MKILTAIWNFAKKHLPSERTLWFVIVAVLVVAVWFGIARNKKLYSEYENCVRNNKAYAAQLGTEKAKSDMFAMTIEQLKCYGDSVTQKLIETKDKLGVKDKEVKQLQYLVSTFKNSDTVFLTDTVFKDPEFKLDTIIGDKWVNTRVVLEYPNMVGVEPEAVSEKNVVIYSKRETIDPPKKFFLCRWFQKKHTVIKVVVDEKNPHIKSQENMFFEIVK